jgi:hypothetical protein
VGPPKTPSKEILKGIFVLLARQGAEACLPWGGVKNKLLGGFAYSRETKFYCLKNEVQYVIIEIEKWLKNYKFK